MSPNSHTPTPVPNGLPMTCSKSIQYSFKAEIVVFIIYYVQYSYCKSVVTNPCISFIITCPATYGNACVVFMYNCL